MSKLVLLQGDPTLKPMRLGQEEAKEKLKKVQMLKKVPVSTCETRDLVMMGIGAFVRSTASWGESPGGDAATPIPRRARTILPGYSHSPIGGPGSGGFHQDRRGSRPLGSRN